MALRALRSSVCSTIILHQNSHALTSPSFAQKHFKLTSYKSDAGSGIIGFSNKVDRRGMAGHSKWQNIKHIKEAKDAQKATLFSKLAQQIRLAIRKGGSADPKMNAMLSNAMAQAKRANMPQAKIDSQIKQILESKDQSKSGFVEIKGPQGVFVLVEVFTDKLILINNNIRAATKKIPGFMVVDNCTKGQFEPKGVIITETKNVDGEDISPEKALDDAIIAGAEELHEHEDDDNEYYQFMCGEYDYPTVKKNLEESSGYVILSADKEYIPSIYKRLNESDEENLEKLFKKLEQFDEVVNTYTNIA